MKPRDPIPKISSVLQLYDAITENERIIVDVLRQVIAEHLPAHCKEKMSYNVPFFCGNKGICIIWPASVPRGGIKKGVLLGFWYGCKLKDEDHYLDHGNNKQVYYKIFNDVEEIDIVALVKILKDAIALDISFKTLKSSSHSNKTT